MEVYLICENCGWSGHLGELVSKTEELEDRDFDYCPDCGEKKFDEEEVEEETD